MNWNLRIYPELARFPSAAAAKAALKAANKGLVWRWRFWFGILLYAVVVGAILNFVQWQFANWFSIPTRFVSPIGGGLIGGTGLIAVEWGYRKRVRAHLRRQLIVQGMPTCLACGYDLTGNESGRCPECGAAVGFAREATS